MPNPDIYDEQHDTILFKEVVLFLCNMNVISLFLNTSSQIAIEESLRPQKSGLPCGASASLQVFKVFLGRVQPETGYRSHHTQSWQDQGHRYVLALTF